MATFISTMRDDAVPSESVAEFVYTLVSADAFTFTHGFADKPRQCEVYLRCIDTDLTYAVGDEVELTNSSQFTMAINKTSVKVAMESLPTIIGANGGDPPAAVTAAKWNLVFRFEL